MNALVNSTRPRRRRLRTPPASVHGPKLRPGEIDIWRAALDDQPAEIVQLMQTLMSADEAERARQFYFERDRRRFIVSRGILRLILADYLGGTAKELVFRYGANGKPILATSSEQPPLHFNVTHSDGLALVAVTSVGEVGIDLEKVRDLPEWEQIAASSFSPREVARIYAAEPTKRVDEFFRAWVRQEAVLKALGVGLAHPRGPQTMDNRQWTMKDFGGPSRLSTVHCPLSTDLPAENANEESYCVYPLNPAPGFVAALATDRTGRWTNCLTWEAREPLAQFPFRPRGRRVRLEHIPQNGAAFL